MKDIPVTLCELHDQYVEQINLAVTEGRDDIVEALSDEFATLTARLDPGAA